MSGGKGIVEGGGGGGRRCVEAAREEEVELLVKDVEMKGV